jgi:uncharacterized protein YndB with AHSA1/START domain
VTAVTAKTGELAVRRSIVIAAPPPRVWEEFTSAERMQRWFACERLVLEPWAGGRFETEGDHGGIHYVFGGKVVACQPPRELTVEWGWVPRRWPGVTLLSFLLQPADAGCTRVEIVHHGFERLGGRAREVYESFERGWDLSELEALKHAVENS